MADHDNPYQKKFLVVVDESPDCDRAVTFAAHRVKRTGGTVVLLSVIEPPDSSQWLGVEDVLRAEARDKAEDLLDARIARIAKIGNIRTETAIREGRPAEEIERADRRRSRRSRSWCWRRQRPGEGAGPLVIGLRQPQRRDGAAGADHHRPGADDRRADRRDFVSADASPCVAGSKASILEPFQFDRPKAPDVHPDRSHAQSGDPEVPARPRRARRRAARFPRPPSRPTVSPLAAALFELPGVTGVFLGSDFISVTKDEVDWAHIKPAVLGAIMEHFLSGKPVLDDGTADESIPATSSSTRATPRPSRSSRS